MREDYLTPRRCLELKYLSDLNSCYYTEICRIVNYIADSCNGRFMYYNANPHTAIGKFVRLNGNGRDDSILAQDATTFYSRQKYSAAVRAIPTR